MRLFSERIPKHPARENHLTGNNCTYPNLSVLNGGERYDGTLSTDFLPKGNYRTTTVTDGEKVTGLSHIDVIHKKDAAPCYPCGAASSFLYIVYFSLLCACEAQGGCQRRAGAAARRGREDS